MRKISDLRVKPRRAVTLRTARPAASPPAPASSPPAPAPASTPPPGPETEPETEPDTEPERGFYGLGDGADGASLPGPDARYELLRLRCPTCAAEVVLIHLDLSDPPSCPGHGAMVLVP